MKNQLQFLLAIGMIATLLECVLLINDTTLIDCENGCNAGAGVTDADGNTCALIIIEN
jgi:hypothetical protein